MSFAKRLNGCTWNPCTKTTILNVRLLLWVPPTNSFSNALSPVPIADIAFFSRETENEARPEACIRKSITCRSTRITGTRDGSPKINMSWIALLLICREPISFWLLCWRVKADHGGKHFSQKWLTFICVILFRWSSARVIAVCAGYITKKRKRHWKHSPNSQ